MHPHLAGHLAAARIADLERELARDAQRAQVRAARSAISGPRPAGIAAAVRRLLPTPVSTEDTRTTRATTTATPGARRHANPPCGPAESFVAPL